MGGRIDRWKFNVIQVIEVIGTSGIGFGGEGGACKVT